MALRIEYLPSAWEDLKRIEDWYLWQFDEATARKVSHSIVSTISRLKQYPDSGSLTPSEWANKRGFRMVICRQHVAFYIVHEESLFIHHIADTREDYLRLFEKRKG